MLRGDKTLTSIVVDNPIEDAEKPNYTSVRDKALTCRFYYHCSILEKRYDTCLRALSKEFFISETVITQRLMANKAYLKQLTEARVTRKELHVIYPSYSWS